MADVVCEFLSSIQKKYHAIKDSTVIDEILNNGAKIVREKARKKYELMRDKVGVCR